MIKFVCGISMERKIFFFKLFIIITYDLRYLPNCENASVSKLSKDSSLEDRLDEFEQIDANF